jgi:integrase
LKDGGVSRLETVTPDSSHFKEHVYEFIDLRLNIAADNTTKGRKTAKNILHKYAREVLNKDFPSYEDFDALFPLRFKNFCFAKPRQHGTNYTSKLLSIICQFLDDAADQGKVVANPLWNSRKYKLKTTEVDDIALTMGEVERILGVYTEGSLLAVRDNFIFACLVGGLRFSDFSKIKTSDFVEMEKDGVKVKMLKVAKTQKTDDKIIIPLHPLAAEILERHGGALPQCPCNQIFNRHIKEICKKAGLTEGVELRENTAGKVHTVTMEKFNCVSAHTARRTFATIAFTEWHVPTSVIMSITGHKTEAQFFRYIKQKQTFAAFEMFDLMRGKKTG